MSNYTKSTNFATKDNLSPGDPLKIVRGTEIDTEFNNISTAISTKTDNSAAAITGGSITGITDLAVADGGTGASTAAAALNNLLPSQTGNATKYLQTDGGNASWDAISLSTSDITGTLPVTNGGTGVTSSTGTGSVVLSNSPTLVTPALGTPASGVATNLTGLPISTGVSGLGTGVATFLGTPSSANLISAVSDETGSGALVFANSPTLVTPALGTPSALVGTNITGTASGLTAGNVTTNANLTGAVTSVGNASSLGSFTSSQLATALSDETGSGSAVFATSPTLVTPILGTPTSATLTNATGLPISTGVSGLGTGIATALAVNTGSAGAPVLFNGALGTPSSGTVTNLTGTASININGTVGATTASTGAFTTLSTTLAATLGQTGASGTTSQLLSLVGRNSDGYAQLNFLANNGSTNNAFLGATSAGLDISTGSVVRGVFSSTGLAVTGAISATTTLGVTGVSTLTAGAVVQGLTVGRGAGGIATNTAVGASALNANTSGAENVAIGNRAVESNLTGTDITAVGFRAARLTTVGNITAFGAYALDGNTTGSTNVAVGTSALQSNTTASNNTAVGYQAAYTNQTGVENALFGAYAGYLNLSGSANTYIGTSAGYTNSTGSNSTMVGSGAGVSATAGGHTLIGASAGGNISTGTNNTVLGYAAGNSSGVINLTTQSNRVVVGDANVTNAYILVAWTVTSDARDKADVTDAPYGLDFVNELRPITYKWDKRDKYENNTPNGTHKETKTQLGFLAQDVIELEKKYGGVSGDLLVADDETEESLKITETKMIPVLVKAIQELKAEFDAYKSTHP